MEPVENWGPLEIFQRGGEGEGPQSIRLTTVNGHVTEDMVEKGDVAAADKVGNDEAGCAQKMGAEGMQSDLIRMGRLCAKRQEAYNHVRNHLNMFLVKGKKSQKELHENIKKEANPINDEANTKQDDATGLEVWRYAQRR